MKSAVFFFPQQLKKYSAISCKITLHAYFNESEYFVKTHAGYWEGCPRGGKYLGGMSMQEVNTWEGCPEGACRPLHAYLRKE